MIGCKKAQIMTLTKFLATVLLAVCLSGNRLEGIVKILFEKNYSKDNGDKELLGESVLLY